MPRCSLLLALLTLYTSDITHSLLRPQQMSTQNAVDEFKAILATYATDRKNDKTTVIRKVKEEIEKQSQDIQTEVQNQCQEVKTEIKDQCQAVKTKVKLNSVIVQRKVDLVKTKLDKMHGNINFVRGKVELTEGKVESIGVKVESTEKKVDLTQRQVDSVENKFDTMQGKVESVEAKVESVERKVDKMQRKVDSVEGKVYSVDGKVNTIHQGMSNMRGTMSWLQTEVTGLVSQFKVIVEHVLTPSDCGEVLVAGNTQSGVYKLKIDGVGRIRAYCSQGFTTFQRRQRGDVDFDRALSEYAEGFGDPSQDHWLGLDPLHALTGKRQCRFRAELSIDLRSSYGPQRTALASYPEDRDGKVKHVEYSTFRVGAGDNFLLTLAGGSTDIRSRYLSQNYMLELDNGRGFTTKDHDVDALSGGNCATHSHFSGKGGFWYAGSLCGTVWPNSADQIRFSYYSADNRVRVLWYPYLLRSVQLKLRC